MNSLEFDFTADNQNSMGKLIAIYDNLSIKTLDKETLEETTGNNIISFFANLIAVHSSNNDDDPREGEVEFEREEGYSMFSYWWKSLRSGIKSTIQRI